VNAAAQATLDVLRLDAVALEAQLGEAVKFEYRAKYLHSYAQMRVNSLKASLLDVNVRIGQPLKESP
jgi:hypothetical protein